MYRYDLPRIFLTECMKRLEFLSLILFEFIFVEDLVFSREVIPTSSNRFSFQKFRLPTF